MISVYQQHHDSYLRIELRESPRIVIHRPGARTPSICSNPTRQGTCVYPDSDFPSNTATHLDWHSLASGTIRSTAQVSRSVYLFRGIHPPIS